MNSPVPDTKNLKKVLDRLEQGSGEKWLQSLDNRKTTELEFHDSHRDRLALEEIDSKTHRKLYGNKKYYKAAVRSKRYIEEWISNNARSSVFLDYACGDGFNTIMAARAGARLAVGIDISPVSIGNAKIDAARRGLDEKTYFVLADAENTKLPDDTIEAAICSGVLHHLDLARALPELRRIMAPGGKILAVEALGYNPLIKLYRYMTPAQRTIWEKNHILSLKDLRYAKRYFNVREIRYWHIASIAGVYFHPLMPFFDSFDCLLTKIPGLRLMSWIFTFELVKENHGECALESQFDS